MLPTLIGHVPINNFEKNALLHDIRNKRTVYRWHGKAAGLKKCCLKQQQPQHHIHPSHPEASNDTTVPPPSWSSSSESWVSGFVFLHWPLQKRRGRKAQAPNTQVGQKTKRWEGFASYPCQNGERERFCKSWWKAWDAKASASLTHF